MQTPSEIKLAALPESTLQVLDFGTFTTAGLKGGKQKDFIYLYDNEFNRLILESIFFRRRTYIGVQEPQPLSFLGVPPRVSATYREEWMTEHGGILGIGFENWIRFIPSAMNFICEATKADPGFFFDDSWYKKEKHYSEHARKIQEQIDLIKHNILKECAELARKYGNSEITVQQVIDYGNTAPHELTKTLEDYCKEHKLDLKEMAKRVELFLPRI